MLLDGAGRLAASFSDRLTKVKHCRVEGVNRGCTYNEWVKQKLKYNTIQYHTVQYCTVQYSTVQYNAMQCNAIQSNPIH